VSNYRATTKFTKNYLDSTNTQNLTNHRPVEKFFCNR